MPISESLMVPNVDESATETSELSLDSQVRERLRVLVKDRSQSDLARKTNTLVSTVNRYLKSTKIPAEFCAAVINGLGVNPAWLMTGEGTPFLADVSAGTSEMASDLLELVEAMNQVARMKLGALTGKHHLKVLRELNDALVRYESLRVVLNRRTSSVLRELLDDFKKALQEMDMSRATEIRKAALSVSRLCDDPNLTVEFDSLQEFYEHIFGDQVKALELSRKVFVKSLGASDVTIDKDHCALAINLVVSLHRADRAREARRICRATLALYEDMGKGWGRYKQLTALHAVLNIELGHMREGLRDLHDTYPILPDQTKRSFSGKLVESMLLSGLTPLEYAGAIGVDSPSKAAAIIRFAALIDDETELANFTKRFSGGMLDDESLWTAYANGLIKKEGSANFDKALARERKRIAVRETQEFAYRACSTHLALATGKTKPAKKLWAEAQDLLDDLDEAVSPQMLALALHHRNAIDMSGGSKSKKVKDNAKVAHEFFGQHFESGYGVFSRWV
ncbi:MAG: helix-turn-helix transcriptional regulator [Planctomycetota bacterium]